ncbi:MAG: DUF6531 domain-containing protein, partial [Clostridiales bacterium]
MVVYSDLNSCIVDIDLLLEADSSIVKVIIIPTFCEFKKKVGEYEEKTSETIEEATKKMNDVIYVKDFLCGEYSLSFKEMMRDISKRIEFMARNVNSLFSKNETGYKGKNGHGGIENNSDKYIIKEVTYDNILKDIIAVISFLNDYDTYIESILEDINSVIDELTKSKINVLNSIPASILKNTSKIDDRMLLISSMIQGLENIYESLSKIKSKILFSNISIGKMKTNFEGILENINNVNDQVLNKLLTGLYEIDPNFKPSEVEPSNQIPKDQGVVVVEEKSKDNNSNIENDKSNVDNSSNKSDTDNLKDDYVMPISPNISSGLNSVKNSKSNVNEKLDEVNDKLDNMDEKIDEQNEKFDMMNEKIESQNENLDDINERLDNIEEDNSKNENMNEEENYNENEESNQINNQETVEPSGSNYSESNAEEVIMQEKIDEKSEVMDENKEVEEKSDSKEAEKKDEKSIKVEDNAKNQKVEGVSKVNNTVLGTVATPMGGIVGGGTAALVGGAVAYKFVKKRRLRKFNLDSYNPDDDLKNDRFGNTQVLGIRNNDLDNDNTEYIGSKGSVNKTFNDYDKTQNTVKLDNNNGTENEIFDLDGDFNTIRDNEIDVEKDDLTGDNLESEDYDVTQQTMDLNNYGKNNFSDDEILELEGKFDTIIKDYSTLSYRVFAGDDRILNGEVEAIGDYVNAATGNYMLKQKDLTTVGFSIIELVRFYNSIDVWEGNLGKNWHHNFEMALQYKKDKIVVVFGNGRTETFAEKNYGYEIVGTGNGNLYNDEDGYIYEDVQCEKYLFSKDGKIKEIIHINNNKTTFVYNDGFLEKVYNNCGEICFIYVDGLLSKIFDLTKREVNYIYNKEYLVEVKDSEGYITKYEYNNSGEIEKIIDQKGKVLLQNIFDEEGKTVSQRLNGQVAVNYKHNKEESTVTYTDEYGRDIDYVHDNLRRIIEINDEISSEKRAFNRDGCLTSFEDKNSNIHMFSYDGNGNLIKIRKPNDDEYQYKYNKNMLVKTINPDYSSCSLDYDENKNVKMFLDETGLKTNFKYNENNFLEEIKFENDLCIRNYYDNRGNVLKVKDQNENENIYKYDELNRIISKIYANGNAWKYSYNTKNILTKIVNPDKTEKVFEYDYRDRLISEIDFNNNKIIYKYDDLDNIVEKIDQEGNVTKYFYNEKGNKTETIYRDNKKEYFEYNKFNNLVKHTDINGEEKKYKYDKQDNVIEEVSNKKMYKYKYDKLNRLIEEKKNKKIIKYEYRYDNKIILITDSEKNKIEFKYDKAGRIISKKSYKEKEE